MINFFEESLVYKILLKETHEFSNFGIFGNPPFRSICIMFGISRRLQSERSGEQRRLIFVFMI